MPVTEPVLMEDCEIIFRNFEGREDEYNRKGERNFCVILNPDQAKMMLEDGWNVKELRPREEGDEPTPYLPVAVSFKVRPPRCVMITSRGRNTLSEDEVELLDWVDVRLVDLMVRPYNWDVNGKSGTKAYLQSIYVTIEEDPLELKYGVTDSDGAVDYDDEGDFANE